MTRLQPIRTVAALAGLLAAGWLGALLAGGADEERPSIQPREQWTNLFAESTADFHFTVKASGGLKGRLTWTFATAGKRVLPNGGRGEAPLAIAAGSAVVKVSLRTPPLNPGVVLKTVLTVTAYAEGSETPAATYETTLWIFPENPFADQTKRLADLKITLFDPDPKKRTAEVLAKFKIPVEAAARVEALGELKEGLLLIGEGVSFKEEPGLAEALVRAAARGLPVLCLAPAAGSFGIPGSDAPQALPSPGVLTLRRQDAITRLDKRLDARAWPPDGTVVANSLSLKADEGKVVGEVVAGAGGWPWVEVDYPDTGGKLVICGFPVVSRWDAGPAPRFLLAKLLDYLPEVDGHKPVK